MFFNLLIKLGCSYYKHHINYRSVPTPHSLSFACYPDCINDVSGQDDIYQEKTSLAYGTVMGIKRTGFHMFADDRKECCFNIIADDRRADLIL